jgi:hypothetical protein
MTQTQPNLLELAKQGNAKAITSVMNYLLKDKGMTAKTGLKNGCLLVFLEADQVPDQQASVEVIHKTVVKLGVASIHSLKVYGRRKGEDFPAWTREFEVVAQVQPLLSTEEVIVDTPKPTDRTKFWDLKTEKVILTFSGHSSGVSSVAFSADGQILASGSWDKTIKIWHCEKPKLLKRISSEVGHRLRKPLKNTGLFLLAIAVFWLISHIGFSGGVLVVLNNLVTAILGIFPGIAGIIILILLVIFLLSGLGRVATRPTGGDTQVNRIQEKPLSYTTINKKNNVDWWKALSKISKNSSSDKVYVQPHRRKDGTYVKGHWRRKHK